MNIYKHSKSIKTLKCKHKFRISTTLEGKKSDVFRREYTRGYQFFSFFLCFFLLSFKKNKASKAKY